MFIKSLKITSGDRVIRNLVFHKGLNLIVDNTPTIENSNNVKTGNNVGKTTVLKLIDYCFGCKAKEIYTDPENSKQVYALVKDYLVDNKVLITLTLKEDLDIDDSYEIIITRNFLSTKNIVRTVNGKNLKEEDFETTLRELLYPNLTDRKPTLREIISHNIRYSDNSISKTLKTLSNFTSDAEYEALYLYLLGCKFEQGNDKQKILSKMNQELSYYERMEKKQTKNAYEAALALVERDIEKLNSKKAILNLNENYEDDLMKLNHIKSEISRLGQEISNLEIRKQLIEDTRNGLESEKSHIDEEQLWQIYSQASTYMENIQRTFDELVQYHNKMIVEKIKYVVKELPQIEKAIQESKELLSYLLQEEKQYSLLITKNTSFSEFEELISELNEKYRKKGEYEEIIRQLTEIEENISTCRNELKKIDETIFSEKFIEIVKRQVNKFNEFFSEVAQTLYNETYALKFDIDTNKKNQQVYKFSTFNANMSTGKKQGEILCFDIAYILFADDQSIPCLHFLLNDRKELLHGNQLLGIKEFLKDKNIQLVASILSDKLPDKLKKDDYYVVELSQDNKLFRIENDET